MSFRFLHKANVRWSSGNENNEHEDKNVQLIVLTRKRLLELPSCRDDFLNNKDTKAAYEIIINQLLALTNQSMWDVCICTLADSLPACFSPVIESIVRERL